MFFRRNHYINILWIWVFALIAHITVLLFPIPPVLAGKVQCINMLIMIIISFCFLTKLSTIKLTKAHKLYMTALFIFAISAICRVSIYIFNLHQTFSDGMNTPIAIFYGGILAVFFVLYPIGVLYPRYINRKFTLKVLSPIFLNLLIITISNYLIDDKQDILAKMIQVISMSFLVAYPITLLIYITKRLRKYIKSCKQSYSNIDNRVIIFVKSYIFGYLSISVSYLLISIFISPSGFIVHYSMCIVFFILTFPFVLLQKESIIIEKDKFKDTNNSSTDDLERCEGRNNYDASIHKEKLENWMENSKPFLRPNFRLLDLMEILPLNRSYISRLINEEYGEPFSHFVMRYRINYSIELLKNHPELTLTKIAELSGFSSSSVFGRSFLKMKGITPAKYRNYL